MIFIGLISNKQAQYEFKFIWHLIIKFEYDNDLTWL